jgi:hypothetical protein
LEGDIAVESLSPLFYSRHTAWLVDTYIWTWPICETLHFAGLALLVGITGLVDLRMLGMAKGLSFAQLHRLIPWAIFGFAIALMTGLIFFTATPAVYLSHWAFPFKLLFILFAGMNVLVFYLSEFKKMESLAPDGEAPLGAKVIGGVSLFLWIGVIFFGRMLGF